MKVLAFGASRNIGYHAALRLLQQGHHVVFLLRRPDVFDNDSQMKPFFDSGLAEKVKGDALVENDVQKAWETAGPVDLVIFSVGGYPKFALTKGFVLDPPDLCTTSVLNVLATRPRTDPQPRFIFVTSNGLLKPTHNALPFVVHPLFLFIKSPHADKLGVEKVVQHCADPASPLATAEWNEGPLSERVLRPGWEQRIPEKGWMKHVVVVRPALLTDGEAKGKYRVGEVLQSCYTVSRKDIAHFIVAGLLENWENYEGRGVSVGY